jgi:O-antigen/teichoic acid export membrane protein
VSAPETPADEGSFRPALLLTLARAGATVFTFLIPVVLARQLAPEVFGAYKQLFLVYVTAYALGQMGIAESLYYFLPRHPRAAGRLVTNALQVLGVAAVACVALVVVGRTWLAAALGNPEIAPFLPLLAVFLGLMLLSTVLEITMIARRQYAWAAVAYVGTDLLRAALFIGPVLAGLGLQGLLAGAALLAALRLGLTFVYLRREMGPQLAGDAALLRTQLGYALPFQLAVVIETAQATLHQYVVSYRFDAATFAVYSVGCLQIPFIELLAGPAGNVMMVRMAGALGRGDLAACHERFLETVRKLALFFFPLLGVLLVTASDLILTFFTSTYAASVPIFRLWCLSVLLAVFPTDCLMRSLAETRFLVVVNVVRLGVIAALVGPLLTRLDLLGPVVATLLGLAVAKGMMLARHASRLAVPFRRLLPWAGLARIGAAAGGAAAVAALAGQLVSAAPPVRLGVLTAVYGFAYALVLAVCPVLTREERRALALRNTSVPVLENRSCAAS